MPNDFSMTNNTTNNRWDLAYTVDTAGTKNTTIKTSGTFVDKDILISITTPSAAFTTSGNITTVSTAGFVDVGAEVGNTGVGAITSGNVSLSNFSYTYDSSNSRFNITTDATAAAPSVDTAGYVSSIVGTKNQKVTSNITKTVAKIVGSTSITGTSTYKPTISKQTISISNVTDASNGSATTTAPTSGVYVAVQSSSGSGTITATPSVTTAGYGTASYHGITGNNQTITLNASDTTYIPIKTSSVTETATTISGSTATRGTRSYSAGWITANTLTTATFANTATSGKTYVDISATSAAPILASGGYLYINKGYTDDLKISLARLVPDDANITPAAGTTTSPDIITGVTAYDKNGTLLTGSMPACDASNISVSGNRVTINTSGYYAANTYKDVGLGAISASISSNTAGSASMAASEQISTSTQTAYYVTLTTTPGSVKAAATVTTAGYVDSGDNTETAATSVNVSGNNTKLYIKAATPTFTGGNLTVSSSMSGINAVLSESNTSGIYIDSTGSANRAQVSYAAAVDGYVKIANGTSVLSAANNVAQGTATRRYITSVTVPKDKPFSVTTTADTALDTTSDLTITNGAYRQVKVTNNGNTAVTNNANATTTVTSGSSSSGTVTINAYNDASTAALTGAQTVVQNGKWKYTTVTAGSSKLGPYYGAVYVNAASSGTAANGQVDITNGGAVKPVLVRQAISISNVTDAASGAGTTTAPSSGVYVAVQSNANTKTLTAKANITTAGYVAVNSNWKSNTSTVGANASDLYYIPITSGVAAADSASADVNVYTTDGSNAGVNISGAIGTKATTEPSSGYYIAMTASGSGTAQVTTAGWFPTGSLSGATASTTATKYFPITAAVIASEGSVSTAPSVTIGGTTNMETASSGTYYFTRTGVASNGTVQTKYKVTTAGYTPTKSATNSGTVSVTPNKTADATVYIPTMTITPVSNTGGLTSKGATATIASGLITDTADNYTNGLTILAKGSATRAAIQYTNTAGYFPAHTSAQTLVSAASASTWNGTTYYIKGVKLTAPSSGIKKFDITVPNGNTTDFITFQFQVDSSGNVTVLGPD